MLGELIGLPQGHASGIDGLSRTERELAGIQMPRVHGQQIVDTAQRNGNEGNLGTNGEEGSAG